MTNCYFLPQSNWRAKHEEFISNLRAARGVTAAQKTGGQLPPPPPPAANPDYVQCPHCSRRFNEHAAERHMPFCKEQKSRLANTSSAKSESLAKRKQVCSKVLVQYAVQVKMKASIQRGTFCFLVCYHIRFIMSLKLL